MQATLPLSRPTFDERETEAVRRVLASGWIVQGPEVEAFESEIAQIQGASHGIAVSSGTAALHVCYLALGIGSGDAVFIPSFAWPSAANMAKLAGATPIFVDVLPRTYNIDSADLQRRIQDCLRSGQARPRAIVPVHQFGLAADLGAVVRIAKEHSLRMIEDAACALGATFSGKPVGTFGGLGIFSFHPRKSITTGEGGVIVTNDAQLAERCRQWRNHGQQFNAGQRDFRVPGLNYRMTEIQAAIGRVQVTKLSGILAQRRALAALYLERLAGIAGVRPPEPHPEHAWQTFMLVLDQVRDRATVIQMLKETGIEAGPGSVAGHLGAHFQPHGALAVSERLHRHGLALPLFAGMSPDDVHRCVAALKNALNGASPGPSSP